MPCVAVLPFRGRRRGQAPPARVLTASGVKITATSGRRGPGVANLAGLRQDWQTDAWAYRNMIGEVRFGTEFLGHTVASAGWYVAQVNTSDITPDGDTSEPISFDSDECTLTDTEKREANEELARLPLHAGSPFLERMVINLAVPGECWLHSYENHLGAEEWSVRSIDELTVKANLGRDKPPVMTVWEGPGESREIDPTNEDVLRLWKPDAAKAWLADSAMRALLDPCEDIVLAGREARAASRSRVASNGVLLVPRGMTLMRTRRDADGNEVTEELDAMSSRFVQTLTEAMINPISNEGDAGAVMPVMLIGDPEDLEKFRHVTFVRETSAENAAKVTAGLQRIATGLDIPADIINGIGDANHWSAWMIDAATAKYHVGPWCRTVADCLTGGFLRASLIDRGWDPKRAALVQVWYDLGPVTENPNRRDDAMAAWDRLAISDEALRRDLGFTEDDKPDDNELFRRIALKTGLQAAEVPEFLRAIMRLNSKLTTVIDNDEEEDAQQQKLPGVDGRTDGRTDGRQLPPGQQGRAPQEGERSGANARGGGTPNSGVPQDTSNAPGGAAAHSRSISARAGDRPSLTASSEVALTPDDSPTDGHVIDVERCHRLPRVEMALVDRILAAADPIIARAVEKAGGRARSQVRAIKGEAGDRLRESLADVPPESVLERIGAQQAMALGLDLQTLLRDSWEPLEERYKQWVSQAVDDEVRAALQILDPSPNAWVPLATPDRTVEPARRSRTQGQARAERKARSARQGQRVAKRMQDRIDDSWGVLSDRLTAAAERQLYRPGQVEVPTAGERPDTLLGPDAVRDALDVVGGSAEGAGDGLAHSPDLVALLHEQGARDAGREWLYGLSPRNTFEPHLALDGTRFRDWDDGALSTALTPHGWVGEFFRPGDHKGCLCRSASLYAVQADPDEFEATPDALRAREIDDALRKLYGISDGGTI